jgi:YegS/Rv2252/BmrU family lipid kinase
MQTPDAPPFWFIIANPVSGGGAMQRRWPAIEKALRETGLNYTLHFTTGPGHAARLADDAALKGYRYVLGIGGDGTNHEIVNGLASQKHVPITQMHYALLPAGSGNDWARQYNLPTDPVKRLRALVQPQTRFQDLGLVHFRTPDGRPDRRYFANVAGLAYDGFIGKKLRENKVTNRFHYLALVMKYLFEYRLTPARITFDGQTADDHFYTINVGLCRYSGGGMQLVPHAVPDDGLFALTFARKVSKLTVLLQTGRFYKGTLLEHPRIEGYQAKEITVEALGGMPTLLEADGEFLGETPVRFELLEKQLNVVL